MTKRLLLSLKRCGSICSVSKAKGNFVALGLALLSIFTSFAQVSLYTFQQSNGTYIPVAEGTEAIATATAADRFDGTNWTLAIPSGFPFNGATYFTTTVNSNGYITFGGAPSVSTTTPINSSGSYTGAISILADDLAACFTPNHVGSLLKETRFDGDQEVLVIEFKNWQRWISSETAYNVMQFQIHLYQDGRIKLVYGDFTSVGAYNNALTAQVGLRGATTTDYLTRTNTTSTPFTSSSASTINTAKQAFSFAAGSAQGLPTSGLTYTYTPPACWGPATVEISNVTTSGFTINATSISSPSFEYEVRTSGLPGSGQAGLLSSGDNYMMPITVNGLPHSTAVTVYVRAMCMESNSTWTSTSASTLCGDNDLPFIEEFNTSIPSCWSTQVVTGTINYGITFVNSSTIPTVNPSAALGAFVKYSSGSSPTNRSERLVTAPLSTNGITSVMVSYDFYHSTGYPNTGDKLTLQYSIDGGTTWTTVAQDMRLGSANEWVRKNYILPAEVVNHPSFKVGFLFYGNNGNNMYLDNVEIKQAPAPTYTAVENFLACSQEDVQAKIIGSNLSNATVTIEGVAATIVNNTFNEITFRAPAGTYGNAVITTATGSVTTTELVDIMTPPALTLSTVADTSCTGIAVPVTLASAADNFTAYNWTSPNNTTVTGSAAEGFNITSAVNNTFILTGTIEMEGRTCIAKDTFTYVAIPNPVVYPNFTTLTLCQDEVQQVGFTAYEVYQPTSGSGNPFVYNFGGLKTQQLFLASELTAMGWTAGNPITSVSLNVITARQDSLRNYRIRINNSSLTSITEAFVEDMQVVFSDGIVLTEGTNTFNFSTPFNWDGVSNVVIEFAFNNGDGGYNNFTLGENKVNVVPTPFASSNSRAIDNNSTSSIYGLTTSGQNPSNRRALMNFGAVSTLTPISQFDIVWTGTNLFTDLNATTVLGTENLETVYQKVGATSTPLSAQITSAQGCVTTVNYTINANPIFRDTLTRQTCAYYEHLGQILYQSGVYIDTLSAVTGCDSIVTLNLTIATPSNYYYTVSSCNDYTFGSQILTESGVYVESFESILGCADSTVHLTFTKLDQVTAFITHQGNTLTAHPSNEDVMYQWIDCSTGNAIPGANSRTFTPAQFGTYKVRLVDGGCIGTSMCVVYSTTGITVLDDMALNVYPNPAQNKVTVTFNSEEMMQAALINSTGQTVKQTAIASGDQMDISDLANGVYLLQLSNTNTVQMVRVVKQ